jgi:hypothetical protein
MAKKKGKKSTYYVTNKDLIPEMKKWKETGEISPELGKMIMDISKNLSNKGSFAGYTWRRDMVAEAVLTCLKYGHNFDPDKSNNPFAYLTTICRNSFLTFIKKQKKHSVIKDNCYKYIDYFMEKQGESYTIRGINYELLAEGKGKEKTEKENLYK